MNDDRLAPDERKAFEALPRERIPNPGLEERTVRTLRRRGLLRAPRRSGITLTPKWATAMAAAVVALVVGGFALGQYAGSRQTAEAMLAMHEQGTLELAVEVQRAGTAYIRALAALAESPGRGDSEAHEQGREAAVAALSAAAELVASLTPDDALATSILRVSEGTRRDRPGPGEAGAEHKIVWF
jgi:hypothetical protein